MICVWVSLAGAPTPRAAPYYPGTTDVAAAQPITVAAGQEFSGVVIRMIVVPARQISGIVVDESGAPVSGALVMMRPDRIAGPMMGGPASDRTKTDEQGRFAIVNVIDGAYTLMAAAPIVVSNIPAAAGGGSITWFSGGGASGAGGIVGGGVSTETVNGITTQFRTDPAHQVGVTVNGSNVTGLSLVAPRGQQ